MSTSWSVEEYKTILHPCDGRVWDRVGSSLPDADHPLSADFSTAAVDALYFDMGAVSVLWSGADATDGVFNVAASIDGTNFCDLPVTNITVDTASGCQLWHLVDIGYRFFRVEFTANTNTTGTANFRYLSKSRRG